MISSSRCVMHAACLLACLRALLALSRALRRASCVMRCVVRCVVRRASCAANVHACSVRERMRAPLVGTYGNLWELIGTLL